ncbi:response regulator [Bradyrhizobium sp. ARR65]|uniref:response regulator n=1 Tax=Bradyrhizobium sp. ARR65 TaxID=1040989 RepID=UPI000465DC90|nr:response regulator [Bradyrhizobium sp. ARR65]
MEELPTILVVEDDPDIQGVVEDALTEGGFQCVLVASAEEAVTLLQDGQKCQGLVADINLRGRMTGWIATRRAREMDPTLPIVYMTAGAGDQWPSQGVPNSVLLQKPFAPAQLVTAVSQLLNTSGLPPA